MGVLGIVPFLLKKCPTAIESIPNRFQALEGKTIAIDGTLITQRLFYAPDQRPYRHVLGWYQLIQELRQNKINVICVFDGKGRIAAKQDEVQRRRLLRAQAQVRGAWEKSRHERLLSLTYTLRGLEGLSTEHQQEVLETLQADPRCLSIPKEHPPDVVTPGLIDIPQSQEDATDYLGQGSSTGVNPLTSEPLSLEGTNLAGRDPTNAIEPGSLLNEMLSIAGRLPGKEQAAENSPTRAPRLLDGDIQAVLEEIVGKDIAQTTPPIETSRSEQTEAARGAKDAEEHGTQKSGVQETLAEPAIGDAGEFGSITEDKHSPRWIEAKPRAYSVQNEDIKALTHKILDLFDHYNRTTASGPDGTIPASGVLAGVQDAPIIPISRVQLKYTQEEAKLWEQLVTSSDGSTMDLAHVLETVEQFASVELPQDEIPSDEVTLEEDAEPSISERSAQLQEQSGLMAASLARRANPPTALTYAESRLILEAMGIPCLQSYLPYEAEALACSLVLNGLADFVGSEDTDVLMYNAPLLRNMTDRKVPLQIIPTSVETALGLSRAAFMDAAILMGTDFVKRVGGIGPSTAWRLMHRYGSIEAMLEQEPKFRPSDVAEYLEQVKVARMIFSTIPPAPAEEDITPGNWDEQAIYDVMSRFGLQRNLDEGQIIPGALSANYYDDNSESKLLQ